jgi:hypothetical protein
MANPSLVFVLIVAGLLLTIAIVLGVVAGLIWLVVKLIMCILALLGAVLSGSMVALLTLVLIVLAAALLYWFIFLVHRLPLSLIGLGNLINIPAVPFSLSELPGTALRLATRASQFQQAKEGLSTEFTIGTCTTDGYTFMYGSVTDGPCKSCMTLTLDTPEQFAMGWTTVGGAERDAKHLVPELVASLSDKDAATHAFWPMIAKFGLAINVIILALVDAARRDELKATLDAAWTDEMETLQAAGRLYVIDMRFFAKFPAATVDGFSRFTPATLTLLARDGDAFAPFWIQVSGQNDAGLQRFVKSDPGWLYALQAAKASITVWGIWLGHVYHWHIVTAAMQMTMFQTVGTHHIVRQLLGRQSNYLIAFDQFLLLVWQQIAPPTSVDTSTKFLQMMDAYAAGRPFSADDPKTMLAALGLSKEHFSKQADWDQYPVVRYLLAIWDATEIYVGKVIDLNYASDGDVQRDAKLQSWIAASGDAAQGNVHALPKMDSKTALKGVLTSLIYRITAHGGARLDQVANPMLTFVANFPPCLQIAEIPAPDIEMNATRLMQYLPKTGTIGSMLTFLFTFIYSPPYASFIPIAGIDADLSFEMDGCNKALQQFRRDIEAVMALWAADANVQGPPAQIHQWALNIET